MTTAHVETLRSNGYELKQNMVANPGYYWVPLGDRDNHPTTFPTPEEAALHYCDLYELEPAKAPWSLVINWEDDLPLNMLAALRAIAEIEDPPSGDRGPIRRARHIAKCAIAKAEGR